MLVYKDGNSGTWRAQFYYTDWTGKKDKKNKRGFKTKKEAQQFEAEYIRVAKADMDMKLSSFVEIYLKDKEVELKQRTLRNKGCVELFICTCIHNFVLHIISKRRYGYYESI